MGRGRRSEKHFPQKNNSIQDSEGNEQNRYRVPNPNKTMINDTKKPINAHKNTLKEEIFQEVTENFMEKILDMVSQNVQDALKKFQDTKNKEHEKTQKQINELRGDLNKHQSETEDTIIREINELKMKIGIPRWRLEVGSRKRPSYSEILERRWRHTLQA
jgi:sugar-specific transcriptional regulator TrmB